MCSKEINSSVIEDNCDHYEALRNKMLREVTSNNEPNRVSPSPVCSESNSSIVSVPDSSGSPSRSQLSSVSRSPSPLPLPLELKRSLKGQVIPSRNCDESGDYKRRKVNYDSVYSLSVSSSPDSVSEGNQGTFSSESNCVSHCAPPCVVGTKSNAHHFHERKIMHLDKTTLKHHHHHGRGGSGSSTKNEPDFNFNHSNYSINDNSNSITPPLPRNNNNNLNEDDEKEKASKTKATKLSFGMDRILSGESLNVAEVRETTQRSNDPIIDDKSSSPFPPATRQDDMTETYRVTKLFNDSSEHLHNIRNMSASAAAAGQPNSNNIHHHHHSSNNHAHSVFSALRCAECYFLGRYCRNNGSLQYSSSLLVNSSSVSGGASGRPSLGVPASFSPWMSASIYENSPLLSPSAYHPSSSSYGLTPPNFSTMSSLVSCTSGTGGRRKRSWSRAVFSSLQRKGLEKRFQIQKYITKPDRRQLAATLGLTDAQVKVWFQNRRMKWRHSKEGKVTSGIGDATVSSLSSSNGGGGSGTVSTTTTVVGDKK